MLSAVRHSVAPSQPVRTATGPVKQAIRTVPFACSASHRQLGERAQGVSRRQQLAGGLLAAAGPLLLRPLVASPPALAKLPSASPFAQPGKVLKTDVSAEQLKSLEVERWPIWQHPVDTYDYTYDVDEDVLLLRGAITITPQGGAPVSFKAGDFVSFGRGLTCTWVVDSPVVKHYREY